jgi:hypothetical protein
MSRGIRSRLNYANVMSSIAVFIALGGGAYAARGTMFGRAGVIDECIGKQGTVRAIETGKHCHRGEQLVAIDEQGAPGKNGSSGSAGLQGHRGEGGATGGQGPTGPQGLVGPTQGFATVNLSGAMPAGTPEATEFESATITTNESGKLFVFARGGLSISCSGGSTAELGLYVDGSPAAGSGQQITTGVTTEVATWGLSSAVSAGSHKVVLQSKCTVGSFTGSSGSGDSVVGGILVG